EDKMPPKHPLAESERLIIRQWIQLGAPGLPKLAAAPAGRGPHWAFRPPVCPPVPVVPQFHGLRTAVDRFIQAALTVRHLRMNPEADRLTLLRRVSFDLTGLPPTLAEQKAFLADHSPDAYERMLERYLASPHYGERWGKYWLDAAGYADSNG